MLYSPHEYQKTGIQFVLANPRSGLFFDPGLGKTGIIYSMFRILRSQGFAKRMLVIAPLRPAHSVWPGEAEKWDEFKGFKVNVLHGSRKNELLTASHDVSVINPEGLDWLFTAMKGRGWWWDVLVVDESTKFRHTNTQRYKTLKPVLPKFKRRHILTGTPAPNGLMDLFGQMYILDLGKTLGQFITQYRSQFFDKTGFGGYTWKIRPGADAAIQARLAPWVLRMDSSLLKLPPLIPNTVELELDEKSRELYEQMEEELLISLSGKTITAANAATATNKCRQIVNGGIYHIDEDTQKRSHEHIHFIKAEAAVEIVEGLGGKPAFIAYEYQHDLERLQMKFKEAGIHAPHIGGGISTKLSRELEEAWNKGWLPVLLAQPQSVAFGLNLQGTGSAVIWHSLPWDLEIYEQFYRRVWRQGQTDTVVMHHLKMKKTIDEAVMAALRRKGKTQRDLLAALQGYAHEI